MSTIQASRIKISADAIMTLMLAFQLERQMRRENTLLEVGCEACDESDTDDESESEGESNSAN